MSEIDPQKLELLRTAMPKGLSAGDGGLTQPRSTSVSVASFPKFSSKVSESKLYTPTLEGTSIPDVPSDQAAAVSLHPFQINASNDFFTVQAGTINNILPQNIFSGGVDLTEFSYSGLSYVILSVNSNDGQISSCTLSAESSAPPQQTALANALPSFFKVLIGVVYNGTEKQIVTNNLRAYGTILFNTYNGTQNRDWYIWTWSNA